MFPSDSSMCIPHTWIAVKSLVLFAGGSIALTLLFAMLQPDRVYSLDPHEFAGSQACATCHGEQDRSTAGYNIWDEANKAGHAFAATPPGTTFPEGPPIDGVAPPPDAPDPARYALVLGGYRWKSTFVDTTGLQYTDAPRAQFNLETREWVPYHPGEVLKFDVECARCHTTGTSFEGSWNGVAEDSLGTFTEPGVQCEGCHGPSRRHADFAFATPEGEYHVLLDRCGDCHNNGGKNSPIPAADGFILNHTQYQELRASRHGELTFFTCSTCHEPHVALSYPELAGRRFNGTPLKAIRQECQSCHIKQTNHPAPIACVDCHMPAAGKSAVAIEFENGGARGDVATHLWRINTAAVTREAMFTDDGAHVKPDASGRPAVTLDFACLGCHQAPDETPAWAASYAAGMHDGTGTSTAPPDDVPSGVPGLANFPNPFTLQTTLTFTLSEPAPITLYVYDASGRRVATLAEGPYPSGIHSVPWYGRAGTGTPLASGLYIARLQAGSRTYSHTLLLVR